VVDLIEPVRPLVDAWLLDLLAQHSFRRSDFYEREDGRVSVLAPLSHELTEMPRWAAELAPWAERAATVFADASPYPVPVPTRLTQRNRRTRTEPSLPPAARNGLAIGLRVEPVPGAEDAPPESGARRLGGRPRERGVGSGGLRPDPPGPR
jgi:hypothetical protein